MLRTELRIIGGEQHGSVITLEAEKFLIGREQDCQLRPNSESISRHHCVIASDEFSIRVRDLGSTNGTFVNGQRIHTETQLKSGDRLAVGSQEFWVSIFDPSSVQKLDETAAQSPGSVNSNANQLENGADVSTEVGILGETAVDMPMTQPAAAETIHLSSSDTSIISNEPPVPDDQQSAVAQQQPVAPSPAEVQPVFPQPVQLQPMQQPYPQDLVQQQLYQQQLLHQQYLQQQYLQQQPAMAQYAPQELPSEPPGTTMTPDQSAGGPPLQLPSPEETGAVDQQHPESSEESSDSKEEQEPQSNPAADIIRKYMNRRAT